ncbi:hypothetical protein L1887_32998 [Cichorium endivia]|nr:hypothetical protein L1887_32998 [Cichorium endivia]
MRIISCPIVFIQFTSPSLHFAVFCSSSSTSSFLQTLAKALITGGDVNLRHPSSSTKFEGKSRILYLSLTSIQPNISTHFETTILSRPTIHQNGSTDSRSGLDKSNALYKFRHHKT